jgi:hypothetical protein
MDIKKRFPLYAGMLCGILFLLSMLFFVASCKNVTDEPQSTPPPVTPPLQTIPIAGRTFTLLSAAPSGTASGSETAPKIHLDGTSDVITIDDGTITAYDDTDDTWGYHSQLKGLLSCAGWEQGDTFTFGRVDANEEFVDAEKICAITKVGAGQSIHIILGSALPPDFFSQHLTFTGNLSRSVNISGQRPYPSVFTLKRVANSSSPPTAWAMYNFYGVEVTPKAEHTLALMYGDTVHLTPIKSGGTYGGSPQTEAVALASDNPNTALNSKWNSKLAGLELSVGQYVANCPIHIINHKAPATVGLSVVNFIVDVSATNPGVYGAEISADVATTVKIDWTSVLPAGSVRSVKLTASGGSATIFTVSASVLPSGETHVDNSGTGIASSSAPAANLYTTTNSTFNGTGTDTQFALSVSSGGTTTVTKL